METVPSLVATPFSLSHASGNTYPAVVARSTKAMRFPRMSATVRIVESFLTNRCPWYRELPSGFTGRASGTTPSRSMASAPVNDPKNAPSIRSASNRSRMFP